MKPNLDPDLLISLVRMALLEDIGDADITTEVAVGHKIMASAKFVAKEPMVVAGMPVVEAVYREIDPKLRLDVKIDEGKNANQGDIIGVVTGQARSILSGERLALNFLQRMSGIASLTRKFVAHVAGTDAVILDTRKTTPVLRFLEKYAVAVGGGKNHRFGLFDQYLFKDNHIAAAALDFGPDIKKIVQQARKTRPYAKVEVEVDTLDQFEKVLEAEPDIILLDNFSLEDLRRAVVLGKGKVFLEASGGITLDTVADVAKTGVEGISVGALTHSAKAVDISLDLELCQTEKK